MAGNRIRLGVLISGTGRTLGNFIELSRRGELPAEVVAVISSNAEAGGLSLAKDAGIEAHVVEFRTPGPERFSERITEILRQARVDLVCLAGFLRLWHIPEDFCGRVMNIHPALLPSFGGAGCYGPKVHEAVLASGARESGCTVHFADNRYDHGPIILQRRVEVLPGDTPETLADRVFREELRAFPEAITLHASGRIRLCGSAVTIVPAAG